MQRTSLFLVMQIVLCILTVQPASAASVADLDRFNGRWKLDWGRSDSFEPVMKLLEVPWLMRRLAGVIPVHVTFEVEPSECEACDPRLRITQQNPIKDTDRIVTLDDVPRPAKDPLGNESLDRFRWNTAHGLEMVRERVLKSGKEARIEEQRKVEDDLETMVSTMTVWIDGEERASIRRVLRRVDK